jgi:RNA polymerase sigma factor (sigma-70 family)
MGMPIVTLNAFLSDLTRRMGAESISELSDEQLVDKALAGPDTMVFQAIVQRHGPMVYRVCWRVLQHDQDTEDAFQATFLVLANKLRSLRKRASLASWLHGVAHRVALKAKSQAACRRRTERQTPCRSAAPPEDLSWCEWRGILDAELDKLPEKWRLPLILCYLEGRTQEEAAKELQLGKTTLRNRLDEARAALGLRLTGRGVVWPAALSAVLLSESVARSAPAPGLVALTVQTATSVAAGTTIATAASPTVRALAKGVVKSMFFTNVKSAVTLALAFIVVGGALCLGRGEAQPGSDDKPSAAATLEAKVPQLAKTDEEKLQGTWNFVSYESVAEPAEKVDVVSLTFQGDRLTIAHKIDQEESGTFSLDAQRHLLDFRRGPTTDRMKYEIDGDTLYLVKVIEVRMSIRMTLKRAPAGKAARSPEQDAKAKKDDAEQAIAKKLNAARQKLNHSEVELRRVELLHKTSSTSLEDVANAQIGVARNRIAVELLTIVEIRTKSLSRVQKLLQTKAVSERDVERARELVKKATEQWERFEKSEN